MRNARKMGRHWDGTVVGTGTALGRHWDGTVNDGLR